MNLFARDYLPVFNEEEVKKIVVIDAGHGGNDPGKVGVNDALEKDINLAIALKLKPYFENNGFTVVMTRETDKALYHETAGNKKRSDLQARVKLCNESNPLMVISIHQNSFQTADCKGAQVFYYDSSTEGKELAEYIQQSLIMNVDSNNKREIKANKSYFLLKEIKTITVIVECGFLSNPDEAANLTSDEYQDKIAYAIFAGATTFLENKLENNSDNDPDNGMQPRREKTIENNQFKEIKSVDEFLKSKDKN